MSWFRKKSEQATADEFEGVMVTLHIDGEQALFLMLAADGSINRVGSGGLDEEDYDMFIGLTDPALFRAVCDEVTPELLAWAGQSRAHPQPLGRLCVLTVGLRRASGVEVMSRWQYGSESQGPPPEIARFVTAAVGATESWFAEQKAMVAGRR
jgi:hypothetical protein